MVSLLLSFGFFSFYVAFAAGSRGFLIALPSQLVVFGTTRFKRALALHQRMIFELVASMWAVMNSTVELYSAGLFTSSIWTMQVEVFLRLKHSQFIGVFDAFNGQSIIQMMIALKMFKKLTPDWLSFSALHEGIRISKKYQTVPRPG
jgi:hypothetical protein